MPEYVPLSAARHGKLRVNRRINAERLKDLKMLPVVVHEFVQAGSAMPIVFVKNPESEQFQPVVLLAFPQGGSLFLDGERWTARYLPGIIQTDPFRLMAVDENSDQLVLAIDEQSSLLGEDSGEALFDGEGKATPFLERCRTALGQYFEHNRITKAFTARLAELDLLVGRELTIEAAGQKFKFGGIFLVDNEKLASLDDAATLDLFHNGYLQAIHSQIMSLQQVTLLAERFAAQNPTLSDAQPAQ